MAPVAWAGNRKCAQAVSSKTRRASRSISSRRQARPDTTYPTGLFRRHRPLTVRIQRRIPHRAGIPAGREGFGSPRAVEREIPPIAYDGVQETGFLDRDENRVFPTTTSAPDCDILITKKKKRGATLISSRSTYGEQRLRGDGDAFHLRLIARYIYR